MLRGFKWAATCRFRRQIHAKQPLLSSSSARWLSTFSHQPSSRGAGAEQGDWNEVSVFWDMENCTIPSGLDPFVVRPNIERALRSAGFLGPISLAGYANINTLCRGHTLESLTETGISIHHVPSSGREASDRALLIDVMFWTMKHMPPAHVLLITGDSDFSVLVHKLRLLGYNVLLAAPDRNGIARALLHAASKIWFWPDIVIGEPEGLVAETHVPGTPLPEVLTGRKKDSEYSKSSMNTLEDPGDGYAKESSEAIIKANMQGGAWLPTNVVERIVNIVMEHPGITLRKLIKMLKVINIDPKVYGFRDFYQLLLKIDQLDIYHSDGVKMADRVLFFVSSQVADEGSAPISPKAGHVAYEHAGSKEASASVACIDEHQSQALEIESASADIPDSGKKSLGQGRDNSPKAGHVAYEHAGSKEASARVACIDEHQSQALVIESVSAGIPNSGKKSLGQGRENDVSATPSSWGSRLVRFLKGS